MLNWSLELIIGVCISHWFFQAAATSHQIVHTSYTIVLLAPHTVIYIRGNKLLCTVILPSRRPISPKHVHII
ncbi:hypothetical protein FB45DRAFT_329409 [Roridomyces roridus]|uniref:Secreted protein n=1 Tax=Roridomyces roridus TaxID=1738132 RepID=A0AAD7FBY6_9AGAR|nr:hypothetical protein FB45DRAFT_329409 [Roridomyces roridus]